MTISSSMILSSTFPKSCVLGLKLFFLEDFGIDESKDVP